jgi:transposase
MNSTAYKQIEKLKRKISTLEAKAAKDAAKRKTTALQKIMVIVKKYGFATLAELTSNANSVLARPVPRSRKRAKITDDVRKAVLADLKKATDSALTIAQRHGISMPSVNNIKKAAGLTKSKKAKAAKKVAPKKTDPKLRKSKKAPAAKPTVSAPAEATPAPAA